EGSYPVSVTIGHDTAPTATVIGSAVVSDPAVVGNGISFPATPGVALSNQAVATFTDPAGPEALADYPATIDGGDNSPPTAGTISFSNGVFTVRGNHTYTMTGMLQTSVQISHDTAPPTTVSGTATLEGQLVVTPPSNQTSVEGA